MNTLELRTKVLLTLQVSLLGMVTNSMRAVTVAWDDHQVHVRILFDQAPTSDELEIVSEIETEIMSHMPEHDVACKAHVTRPDHPVPAHPGESFVFQRAKVAI